MRPGEGRFELNIHDLGESRSLEIELDALHEDLSRLQPNGPKRQIEYRPQQ